MGTGSFSKQIIDNSSKFYDFNIINEGYDRILRDYCNNNNTVATLHSILRGIPIMFGVKSSTAIIIAYKYIHKLDNKWIFNKYENDETNTSYYVSREDFVSILRLSFICNHIFDIVPDIVNDISELLANGKPLLIPKGSWLEKISKGHGYDVDKISNFQGYNNLVKFDEFCNQLAINVLPSIDKKSINPNTLEMKAMIHGLVSSSINDAMFNLLSKGDSNLQNVKELLKNLKLQELEIVNKHIDSEVLSARKRDHFFNSQSAPNSYRK